MILAPAHPWKSLAAILALAAATPALGCGATTGEARLTAVNARLELRLDDGRLARLAGLDAPEPAAAKARLDAVGLDKRLSVAVLAPRPDRWGRWLVDLAVPDGASLSDVLLAEGLVRVAPEFETRACEAARLAIETRARNESRGLWDDPGSIVEAGDVEALAAADARLVLVEGVVRRVGATRARYYLDFGRRGGFTVVVARKADAAFRRSGIDVAALAGHAVRVRGYLSNRFGPRIELADPLLIERTEGVGGSEPGG